LGRYAYRLSDGRKWNACRLKRYLPSPLELTELALQSPSQWEGGIETADEDGARIADVAEDVADAVEVAGASEGVAGVNDVAKVTAAVKDVAGVADAVDDVDGIAGAREDAVKVAGAVNDVPEIAVTQDDVADAVEDVAAMFDTVGVNDIPGVMAAQDKRRRKDDRWSTGVRLPRKRGRKK
ncbi:MAG: hypothetical protein GY835_08825, partial [bacterium]|nr:hypothetical protein [bacterium]